LRRISTGSPQDLLTQGPARDNVRTPRRFHEDLFKSFSQGPAQDHAKALTAFHQDLHKIFSQGAVKDQDLHASCKDLTIASWKNLLLLERILQDLDTRTSQEPPKRLPRELSYKQL